MPPPEPVALISCGPPLNPPGPAVPPTFSADDVHGPRASIALLTMIGPSAISAIAAEPLSVTGPSIVSDLNWKNTTPFAEPSPHPDVGLEIDFAVLSIVVVVPEP